jgi:beta-N-acetylhexosaminidase
MNLREKPFYLDEQQLQWVENTFAGLNDRQKAGQLFCVLGDLYGEEELLHMAEESYVGGILFRPCGIDTLVDRNAAFDHVAAVPILKAANLEEGGDGAITDGRRFACQMQVAATGDVRWAERLGMQCARAAEVAGINLTFSPVADIDLNFRNPITNTRTYGSDPSVVAQFTTAYMKAVQSCGIAACAKHFPGDGVDYRDQHLHPTINSLSTVTWEQSYGKVYRSLIDNGVLCVMAAHILQPCWSKQINPLLRDEDILPASLSRELMTNLLREHLGFEGLVLVDATIMGGFTQRMKRRDAIPAAIEAGGDMLIFNTDFREDLSFVLQALDDGRLSHRRLDEAVRRILALKAHLRLYEPHRGQAKRALPVSEWIRRCAERSVTLVKDKENRLPLTKENTKSVRLIMLGNDETPEGRLSDFIMEEFKKRGIPVTLFDPAASHMTGVGDIAEGRVDLYAANYQTRSDQTTVRLFWDGKFVLDLPRFLQDVPSIFVSFGNPYHLQDVPGIKTFINAYTPTQAVVKAVVAKLCGEQKFLGKSPVDPFCDLYDTQL